MAGDVDLISQDPGLAEETQVSSNVRWPDSPSLLQRPMANVAAKRRICSLARVTG
jgi:hypothetical protein